MYQSQLQQTLSCVTDAVLSTVDAPSTRSIPNISDVGMALNKNTPVRLVANHPITMDFSQWLRIERSSHSSRREWHVTLIAYSYVFRIPESSEICSYQWHPAGRSPVRYPHLHIGRGATGNVTTFGPRGRHRIHFPTRHITIEDVLRLAIAEFGVEPRRPDWESILNET